MFNRFAGMIIGELCIEIDLNALFLTPKRLLHLIVTLTLCGALVYGMMVLVFHVDPNWTIELAKKQ